MAKYISNRLRNLTIGLDSYSEDLTSLSVIGDVKIGAGVTIDSSSGIITAVGFKRIGGTSSDFLMADGSVNSTTFLASYTETDTLDNILGRGNTTTKNLTVGDITADNISVGGTITYDDVTSVDSVGLITARNGIHVTGGNVGIGTTNIEAPFQVAGENSQGLVALFGRHDFIDDSRYNYRDATIGLLGQKATGVSTGAGVQYTTRNLASTNWHHAYTTFDQVGTYHIGLGGFGVTSATDKITILSTGAVGIGTDNPTGLLHIQSNNPTFRISDANQATDNKTWNISGGNSQVLRIQALNDSNNGGSQYFDFYRDGNSVQEFRGVKSGNPWFVINNNDRKVGIGTTIAKEKLHVVGVVSATSFFGDGSNLSNLPASGISDVVSDTTPQLGGNLDLNSKIINGSGNIDYTGNFKATGIVTATSVKVGSAVTLYAHGIDVTGIVSATSFDGTLASGDVATSANSIVLGRISGGAGSVEELTPTQIRTLLNVEDGSTAASGINNVVDDGTPELGGYLDLNNKGIFGVGVITATSFVGSGASLTALPALTNSKSILTPQYPAAGTFTVWLAARYNVDFEHYVIDSGNFGSGVSADRTGNISGTDVDININVGDTLILDTATQATLNNAAGGTFIKTAPGTGMANRVGYAPDTNPLATNNGASSTNISWSPTVAGTYYYQNGSRVNMVGQIIVSPTADPPASKFISAINFNSEGRVVGVVTFNGINAATNNVRGIVQIYDDPNLTVNSGIVSIAQSLNLTGIVTAASFSGSAAGMTGMLDLLESMLFT